MKWGLMPADELDVLLRDRFNLSRADLVSALKMLPAYQLGAASLTPGEAGQLDAVGFIDDPGAFATNGVNVIVNFAQLIATAYTSGELAAGAGLDEAQVERRRLAGTLWAINNDGAWVYPAAQFDVAEVGGRRRLDTIRELDRVLAVLPADLHPMAVNGLLLTPQWELAVDGRPLTVVEWLRTGGPVEAVLRLIEIGEWAGM
jgi:hypothetical protein